MCLNQILASDDDGACGPSFSIEAFDLIFGHADANEVRPERFLPGLFV